MVEKQLKVVAEAWGWLCGCLITKPLGPASSQLGGRERQSCQQLSVLPSKQILSIQRPWALRNSSSSHQ